MFSNIPPMSVKELKKRTASLSFTRAVFFNQCCSYINKLLMLIYPGTEHTSSALPRSYMQDE